MNRGIVWIFVIVIILIGAYAFTRSEKAANQGGNNQDTTQEHTYATSTSGRAQSMNDASGLTGESRKVLTKGQVLIIQDTQVGTGAQANAGDTVQVNYVGRLTNGTKFDASFDHGKPFEFTLGQGQVIEGWDKGVIGMKVGGKRTLTVPPALAYGNQAVGAIPANSTLVFEIDLLAVNGKK